MRKTLLFMIGLGATGCAHHPAPTEQVATSLSAVRGAEEAGANDVPEAALHVKLAQEQLDLAKKLMEDEYNARAEDKALRANQDAELALAIARQSASRRELDKFASSEPASGGERPATPPAGGMTP